MTPSDSNPITRAYYENGQVWTEAWRNDSGEVHRLDGPAYSEWYDNGQLCYEEWYINGVYHRLDGPAYTGWRSNGQLQWEHWYVDGKRHRLDGPAIVRYSPTDGRFSNCEYWINGVEYKTEAEFQVAVDLYKANEIADLF